jgi:hypothetical protein
MQSPLPSSDPAHGGVEDVPVRGATGGQVYYMAVAASRSAGCSLFAARYARTLRGALRDLVFVLSLTSRFYRLSVDLKQRDSPLG